MIILRTLYSYVVTSLDGYYTGPNGEFDWANVDAEYFQFANQSDAYIDTLLFGRVGYEFMASYWPTATEADPEVTTFMNSVEKVVVSSTLDKAEWNNTTIDRGQDLTATITELKRRPGREIALFGSVTLTASLLELGLVDELRILVSPIILGEGRSLYSTVSRRIPLELWRTTSFRSGNVLLTYRPA
ncbi:dihydrofolate reductase family protein [Spiractinospora alimapuensis]|uniref:dihydrofolate reductase family protein n=1 Tax=Spiractinospora alimapuensis TaxID=2820884 RepID=UPI001F2E84FB|nr:dihydrofolate reductase family protein [Spiractinospora alimapuensis]QVQ51546.1 dihydrofolate reductase family protein [Spiractinospora alimapuensis]